MKKYLFILLFIFSSNNFVFSQYKNSIWCFGDSALINFSDTANIITGSCAIRSRGSCVSIADNNDSLLFYANTRATMAGNTTLVYNRENQVMVNGSNVHGEGWYHELIIIPMPGSDSLFYLFTIGVTGSSSYGLKYSIIDMSLDSGRGEVIQKNIQLQSFEMVDCLSAMKHGNGRDWWILFRKSDFQSGGSNNDWYEYLITPTGISSIILQNKGSLNSTNLGKISFSSDGEMICFSNYKGLIELYSFDRCTGVIDSLQNISPETQPIPYGWSSEFSLNGQVLYVSTHPVENYLFQYDLTAPNISLTKDTIWTSSFPTYAAGDLKLAPDNKIYFSSTYYNGFQFPYPYPDTVYNIYNMNLSVINSPDSLGAACDFQPFSFYLGGKRTYWGLPNNPDYELGAWVSSPCDTLGVGIEELEAKNNAELFVYYHPAWQTAFINAQKLKGRKYGLHVYDILGKEIFKQKGKLFTEYFTKDFQMQNFSNGIYIISFETEKEKLIKKFIKN